jgi:hypothetical protein
VAIDDEEREDFLSTLGAQYPELAAELGVGQRAGARLLLFAPSEVKAIGRSRKPVGTPNWRAAQDS